MNLSLRKKTGIVLTLMTLSLSQIAAPTSAHALLGSSTLNPAIGLAGLYLVFTSAGLGITGVAAGMSSSDGGHGMAEGLTLSSILTLLGGLFLMDQDQGTLKFQEITPALSLRYGLSDSEVQAYNSELDKIQLANQTVLETLSQDSHPTSEKAAVIWSELTSEFSPQTQAALAKIMNTENRGQN